MIINVSFPRLTFSWKMTQLSFSCPQYQHVQQTYLTYLAVYLNESLLKYNVLCGLFMFIHSNSCSVMSLQRNTTLENWEYHSTKNPKSSGRWFLSLCYCREFTTCEEMMYAVNGITDFTQSHLNCSLQVCEQDFLGTMEEPSKNTVMILMCSKWCLSQDNLLCDDLFSLGYIFIWCLNAECLQNNIARLFLCLFFFFLEVFWGGREGKILLSFRRPW